MTDSSSRLNLSDVSVVDSNQDYSELTVDETTIDSSRAEPWEQQLPWMGSVSGPLGPEEADCLKVRKLILFLNLDRTLFHAVKEEMCPEESSSRSGVYSLNAKVRTGDGGSRPWTDKVHTRPGVRWFLKTVGQHFRIFASVNVPSSVLVEMRRLVCNEVCGDQSLLEPRIFGRKKGILNKQQRIRHFLKYGDSLSVKVDDSPRQWLYSPNLLRSVPYLRPNDMSTLDDEEGKFQQFYEQCLEAYPEHSLEEYKSYMTRLSAPQRTGGGAEDRVIAKAPWPSPKTSTPKKTVFAPKASTRHSHSTADACPPHSTADTSQPESTADSSQPESTADAGQPESSSSSRAPPPDICSGSPHTGINEETSETTRSAFQPESLLPNDKGDTFLAVLAAQLYRLWELFFAICEDSCLPDTNLIVSYIKSKVLQRQVVHVRTSDERERLGWMRRVRMLGAELTDTIDQSTTHVVTDNVGQYLQRVTRKRSSLQVVKAAWLMKCESLLHRADESPFLHCQHSSVCTATQ